MFYKHNFISIYTLLFTLQFQIKFINYCNSRSLWLDFAEEAEVLGIPVYRYRPAEDVFAMDNPNNYCYCPEFHQCASRMAEKDEWDFTKCKELCKDGMLKVQLNYYLFVEHKRCGDNIVPLQNARHSISYKILILGFSWSWYPNLN